MRLIAAQFVTPYRKSSRIKNDAADAAAICEAVARPNMRFVPIKSVEQQSQLFIHRARQGYVEHRTALINRIRGLLSELGIVLPLTHAQFCKGVHAVLEDLPGYSNRVIGDLMSELNQTEQRLAQYDQLIAQIARQDAQAKRLMQIQGVGATTGHGHRRQHRQRARFQQRAPVQRLAGAGAQAAQLGRQDQAGAHHQGG